MRRCLLAVFASALLAVGCGDDSVSPPTATPAPTTAAPGTSTTKPDPEPLALVETEPPDGLALSGTFYDAIAYDGHAATVLDLAVPTGDALRPLVIYFHGGGFVEGGRARAYEPQKVSEANAYLAAGFAFASVDYRLLDDPTADGILTALIDSRRALQFLRAHADQLGLDPTRVLLTGGSAGAGTALWIAFGDDAARPDDPDPVLRQSTRVSGVVAIETQATFDILRWGPDVFPDDDVDVIAEAAAFDYLQVLLGYYDIETTEELESTDTTAYRAAVDMLAMMTPDDPPFWGRSEAQPAEPPWKPAFLLHAGHHLEALQRHADAAGIEHTLYAPAIGLADPSGETDIEFATRVLAEP